MFNLKKTKKTLNREYIDIQDVRKFVRQWNNKYPIDRWWRERYNVSFGSELHLNQSLLDMRIAFEEEMYFKKMDIESSSKAKKYSPGRGDWLSKQPKFNKMTNEDVDDIFDKLSSNMDMLKNISTRNENGKNIISI
jgi:hypothetical protein